MNDQYIKCECKFIFYKSDILWYNKDNDNNSIYEYNDVTTTGNSLYACKEILERNGAIQVEMFALGKAI